MMTNFTGQAIRSRLRKGVQRIIERLGRLKSQQRSPVLKNSAKESCQKQSSASVEDYCDDDDLSEIDTVATTVEDGSLSAKSSFCGSKSMNSSSKSFYCDSKASSFCESKSCSSSAFQLKKRVSFSEFSEVRPVVSLEEYDAESIQQLWHGCGDLQLYKREAVGEVRAFMREHSISDAFLARRLLYNGNGVPQQTRKMLQNQCFEEHEEAAEEIEEDEDNDEDYELTAADEYSISPTVAAVNAATTIAAAESETEEGRAEELLSL